ncbi:MAG TPA: DUF6580 family putative transport protein [Chitinophagaceae bacterium]|nr:DUF6580 family putative transport protein [Chitinophagaceae bacterium]
MTRSNQVQKYLLLAGLIILATLGRLFTNYIHLWNFAPIGAIGLFGGFQMKNKRQAYVLLLAVLLSSDLCLALFTPIKGFYGWSQLLNYAAFLLIVYIGTRIHRINTRNVVLASLGASILFFTLSNFGVWLFAGGVAPYTPNPQGLLNTYLLAIPFLGNTIAGDLFFCTLLFGSWALVRHLLAKKTPVAS